ncbi:MAG: hypothetical protein AAF542_25445 [Pseudomonadota bacterium]
MSIYLRDGGEITIDASECRREYSAIAKQYFEVWYVKARPVGKYHPLHDGQWIPATQLTADRGWKEIERTVTRLQRRRA